MKLQRWSGLLLTCLAITTSLNAQSTPQTIVLRGEWLADAKSRIQSGDAQLKPALDELIRNANAALQLAPVAVTDKKTLLPPTNDPHDYFSLSPYWWPDSTKPNGLPYIRRDGVTNPESKRDLDQPRVHALGDRTQTLALAWYFTGDDRYGEAAARQIKRWFLDPQTRMNPHLRFAQLVRGNPRERGSGIIDTRWFIEVVDAASLLRGSKHWSTQDDAALKTWFRQYLNWLLTSPNGAHEQKAKNNHGSWFAAQTAAYALYVGDNAKAKEIIEAQKARIGAQIKPDGSQPEELARTRSFHYEMFNVEALGRVAEMGRHLGVDLWGYTAPEGGSLRKAVDRLAMYAGREKDWPGNQISDVEPPLYASSLRRAAAAWQDANIAAAVNRISGNVQRDKSALLYPLRSNTKATQSSNASNNHPKIFITKQEAADIKSALGKYPLLDSTFAQAQRQIDAAIATNIDVPQPGEAGGYAHEKHKQNYREMQTAGLLYQITGESKYAKYVRDVLEKYAVLYPTLGAHPLSKNQAPGKLFHQALNEANWLVAVSIAYDAVYDALTPQERQRFESTVLRPMADWLSVHGAKEFDRIHNHGTWATAAVGMLGLVIDDKEYVDKALYGTKKDKTGGFLRQLDLLFSPDGYYMEGPYYIRYALMPFYYFAEALHRNRPDVGIYQYRNRILEKALYSAVQTAFPNGVFPPINDASRTMAITAPEVILAVDLAYDQYGANPNLLGAAAIQNQVVLNKAGLKVARDIAGVQHPKMSWGSIEFTDGNDGKRGGLGILRTGIGQEQSMLLMKYGVHGEGHGHFDKLHFIFFDGGREVVPDYGFSRWINIEPKFGGRYLPENDSYAMQTIAHNTVVVDQTTQNRANFDQAEAMWAQRHWFDARDARKQAMSAKANGYYPGVDMQRAMLLVRDQRLRYPVVIDLYRLKSAQQHSYDYPVHFRGQLISTNITYAADTLQRTTLGTKFGYEHIWKEATGRTSAPVSMTWLDGNRYYTVTTSPAPNTEVIFGRTGAEDPNFNLIVEPMMIVRRQGSTDLFASVIEPHGYFNEAQERSEQARPIIKNVRVIGHSDEASVVEVTGDNNIRWTVMVWNGAPSETAPRSVTFQNRTYTWTGNFAVEGLQNAN